MSSVEEKLQDVIVQAHKLIQKQKIITEGMAKERDRLVSELAELMIKKNKTEYKFKVEEDSLITYIHDDLEDGYSCKFIEATKIIYDAEKIEEKFDKEFCNEVINKTYIVNNIDGLVKLLKQNNVNPNQFKKFIEVEKTVSKEKLEQLFEIGDLSLEQLAGCYDTKKTKGRWSIGKN